MRYLLWIANAMEEAALEAAGIWRAMESDSGSEESDIPSEEEVGEVRDKLSGLRLETTGPDAEMEATGPDTEMEGGEAA